MQDLTPLKEAAERLNITTVTLRKLVRELNMDITHIHGIAFIPSSIFSNLTKIGERWIPIQ